MDIMGLDRLFYQNNSNIFKNVNRNLNFNVRFICTSCLN